MLVVDVNVLLAVFVEGPNSRAAKRELEEDPDWQVPDLWRSEFANGLRSMQRSRVIKVDDARRICAEAEELFGEREHRVSGGAGLDAALQYDLTAYDGVYVALAESLGCKLLTLDREVLAKVAGVARGLG